MKKIKKIMAAALAVVMTMALSLTAFAVGTTGNLTVNVNAGNTLKNQTLAVYELFTLKDGSYEVNPTYKDILIQVLKLDGAATSGDIYQAVKNHETDIQTFANKFTEEALKQGVAATQSETIRDDRKTHEFVGLNYGYYLVYQSGTQTLQSSLVNFNDQITTVDLKGIAPSIEKKADQETVSIGQVVTYTITGTIPDTTGYDQYVYKIHDTLTDGLDFVADTAGTAVTDKMNVTVQVNGGAAETVNTVVTGKTMELDLSAWVKQHQADQGKTFTVTYYAKVNSNAVVQNKNSASLEYGNQPGDTVNTVPSVVVTPTYALDVNKVVKGSTTMLAGATFRVYTNLDDAKAANDNALKVTAGTAGSYTVAADQSAETNMDMVTVADPITAGVNLHLNGLAAGQYYLVETAAPDGYNKLSAPITITIAKGVNADGSDWTISKDGAQEADKIIDIENSTGTILPNTGGMGTMIFTVIAVALIVGVAVSFVYSRKKSSK